MDKQELIMTIADALGRRLGIQAAGMMAEALPAVSDETLEEAARRMIKENDRFVFRDLLRIIDEVQGDRPLDPVKGGNTAAAMARIRRELDIPERDEDDS